VPKKRGRVFEIPRTTPISRKGWKIEEVKKGSKEKKVKIPQEYDEKEED